ncbi:MAG: hypothetical protein ACK5LC_11405 [Coprobacillaceae bacterium]
MKVTKHGSKRIKERLNIKKSSHDRLANAALKKGYRHNQIKGNLRKWIDKQILNKDIKHKPIVYNSSLFIFSVSGNKLITVIKLPTNLQKNINDYIIKAKEM